MAINPDVLARLMQSFGGGGSPGGLDTPAGSYGRDGVLNAPPPPQALMEEAAQSPDFPGLTPTQAAAAARVMGMIPQPTHQKEAPVDFSPRGGWENAASFMPEGFSIPYGRPNHSGANARVTLANFLLQALGDRGRTMYKARTGREAARLSDAQKANDKQDALYETRRSTALSMIGAKMVAPEKGEESMPKERMMTPGGAALIGRPDAAGKPREEVKMIPKPPSGGGGGSAAAQDIGPIKPSQLDADATYYAITAKLPPWTTAGTRNPSMQKANKRIAERASEMFPGNSLALAGAASRGDTKALSMMTEVSTSVDAFAGAAELNLGRLEGAVKRVPDTGIPVLNMKFRDFARSFAGDADIVDFLVYRESILNEYGKLINTPKMSAMGLTVSARKNMELLMSEGATVDQVLRAARALRNEAANRQTANKVIMDVVRGRLSTPQGITEERKVDAGFGSR